MTQFNISGSEESIGGFTAELEQLKAKAEHVQDSIRSASATVRSPDGAVTVTVGPGGALTNLAFDARAYRRPPEALSALVLQLIGVAQKRVSAQVATAFTELVGENSQAMHLFEKFVPTNDQDTGGQGEPASPPPPPPAGPPPAPPALPPQRQPSARPPARPAAAEDDDGEFENPW